MLPDAAEMSSSGAARDPPCGAGEAHNGMETVGWALRPRVPQFQGATGTQDARSGLRALTGSLTRRWSRSAGLQAPTLREAPPLREAPLRGGSLGGRGLGSSHSDRLGAGAEGGYRTPADRLLLPPARPSHRAQGPFKRRGCGPGTSPRRSRDFLATPPGPGPSSLPTPTRVNSPRPPHAADLTQGQLPGTEQKATSRHLF